MWMKLGLLSFIAVCLLPSTVISQSGNLCSVTDLKSECNAAKHNILDEANRLVTGSTHGTYCDQSDKQKQRPNYTKVGKWLGSGWYRFTGAAGTRMIDQNDAKPGYAKCGTYKTGYIAGSHPYYPGQTIDAKICIRSHWNTCEYSAAAKITHCGSFFVYQLPDVPVYCSTRYCGIKGYTGLPDQCSSTVYKTMNEASRSTTNGYEKYHDQSGFAVHGQITSPSWKGAGWYRVVSPAGTRIPEKKEQPVGRGCGCAYTGYVNDQHPTTYGQTKDVKFCFDSLPPFNDCAQNNYGKVTNCGSYYVYYLKEAPRNGARYCAVP